MAGKHMAQPMAETSTPYEPALSPIRVNQVKGLAMAMGDPYCLTLDG